MDKNAKVQNSEGQSFTIKHHLKGKEFHDWANQFKKNEQYRKHKRKNQNYLMHTIISFDKRDDVSLEQMEDLANEFIRQQPSGIYLAVPHFDKEHRHIHLCCSAISYRSGKSLRLSKAEFQKLKQDLQNYQQEKYPELSYSVVQHGRKSKPLLTEKEYQFKRRNAGRETNKEQLIGILQTSYSNALSKSAFFENLSANDVSTYSRNGRLTGIKYKGRKFRFSRLGFDIEKLKTIDKSQNRLKEISNTRGRKGRGIDRNI